MANNGPIRAGKIQRLAACFEAGDFSAAEKIARELTADDPQDEEALHLLAQTVFKQGRSREAVELMRSVLEIEPARASYYNDYGVMHAAHRHWDDAVAAYGIAAVLDRNNADARFNLALAFFRTLQRERARAELERVLAQWPDLPDALALDGELSREEGNPARAVESLRKAIELGRKTPADYINLALALEDMERGEEARQTIEQVANIDADACLQLGNFYNEKGDEAQAERLYLRVLALCPDSATAHNNLGLLLQKNDRRIEQAAECFERALSCDPNMEQVRVNLARLDANEGRMERAIDRLLPMIAANPRQADAWNGLGYVYSRLLCLDESEKAFRRALEIRPDFATASGNLGLLLLRCGRFAEGWPYYESRW